MICSWLEISVFEMHDSKVCLSRDNAPFPAVSSMVQLPRVAPGGNPLFSTKSFSLLTIVSVGFSATPWNFLNPVTWMVTALGPSDPISTFRTRIQFPIFISTVTKACVCTNPCKGQPRSWSLLEKNMQKQCTITGFLIICRSKICINKPPDI